MNFFILINHNVSYFLNNFVLNYHLEKFVWFFADFPIFFIPIFLVSAWLYYAFKNKNVEKKKDLILIVFAPIFGLIVNIIIQHFIHIQRPETFVKPILTHIPDASFPSDHAVVSFAFLFSLYVYGYKKVFWIFLPFVILMNLSRIAGGIHWFFDVFVWMIIAFLSVLFVYKIRKNKKVKAMLDFLIKIASLLKL